MSQGLSRRRFRCTGCGNCCRSLRVPLTNADLVRLARATGQPAEAIVDWLTPDDVDMSGEPSSFVELDTGRRLMVLAHESGACRWLADDRCLVWSARPSTCRTYPLEASVGRRGGVRRLRVLERGIDCRYELDGVASLADLRRDQACERAELARYHELVQRWNIEQRRRRRFFKRAGSATKFLARVCA